MNAVTPAPASPKKSRAVAAGLLCFVLGMVLMFVSLGTFFLYGPLLLAAFVLSIVGMAQGRVAAGIFLLLATVSIPTVTWFGLVALRWTEASAKIEAEKAAKLASVVIEDVNGRQDYGYVHIDGKVRNKGSESVDFVKVAVELLSKDGTVLDTNYTYAVSGEGLAPGSAKSFTIMAKADDRMTNYRYYVVKD